MTIVKKAVGQRVSFGFNDGCEIEGLLVETPSEFNGGCYVVKAIGVETDRPRTVAIKNFDCFSFEETGD